MTPWTRGGRCEFGWKRGSPIPICTKRARWQLPSGELRCGEHKNAP